MSLKYAILGLLSYKPQTGYEIKANFSQSIRYLWDADQTQIYRTLSEITKEQLAVSKIVLQEDRPNKKVYGLTEKGHEELKKWLANPVQVKNQRNTELLQIFFSGMISDKEILMNIKRLRDNTEKALKELTSLESVSELFNPKNTSKRVNFFYKATLDLGIRTMKMNLDWIEEIINKLENGKISSE